MKLTYLSGCLALVMATTATVTTATVTTATVTVTTAMAEETLILLFDFTRADAAAEWQTVNDGVMGGVSEGKFRISQVKTMEFFGTLSFVSARPWIPDLP